MVGYVGCGRIFVGLKIVGDCIENYIDYGEYANTGKYYTSLLEEFEQHVNARTEYPKLLNRDGKIKRVVYIITIVRC